MYCNIIAIFISLLGVIVWKLKDLLTSSLLEMLRPEIGAGEEDWASEPPMVLGAD